MIVLFDNYDGYDFETIKEELEELNGIATATASLRAMQKILLTWSRVCAAQEVQHCYGLTNISQMNYHEIYD